MKHTKYLLILAASFIIGWTSWILVILKLDPCTGPGQIAVCHSLAPFSLFFFFLSAFFALTATFTLLGLGMRFWFNRYEIYVDHLNVSLRQGILLTLCSLGALGLLLLKTLTWWSGLLLVFIIIFLELYFSRSSY